MWPGQKLSPFAFKFLQEEYNIKMKQSRPLQLPKEIWIAATILIIALIIRIYGAWCLRFHMNVDAGVVALMVKHITEGINFPVFFYGQAHMGSFEAALSALFCRIFGVSGLSVTMGTVVPGFLLLPVVYFWARDIGGRTAASASTIYCIIGALGFLHYSVSPRGGYAAIMLFGALALWMSSRIVTKTIQSGRQPVLDYFLLGLAGGIGWWSGQLITAALFASALLLVMGLRSRVFTWRLLLGLAGFFLGSLPFWVYNVLNAWPTFAFTSSLGRIDFLEGSRLFFSDRFLSLAGLLGKNNIIFTTGVAIYLAAVAIAFCTLASTLRQKAYHQWVPLLAGFLFLFFSWIIFSTSHFALTSTPRYLLPLVPLMAVFLGNMTSYLCKKTPYYLGWAPMLFLVSLQLPTLQWAWEFEKDERLQYQRAQAVGSYLEEHNVSAAYAMLRLRPWNFALREKVILSQVQGTFYKPYEQYAELDDNIAILGDYGGVNSFLKATSTSAQRQVIGGYEVHHVFIPPSDGITEISPELWQSVHDSSGNEILSQLTDIKYSATWQSPQSPYDDWIEITFQKPQYVSKVRLWTGEMLAYPRALQIEGLVQDGASWQTLHPAEPVSLFFWSGNRPFWFGDLHRLEYRFPPTLVEKLRLHNASSQSFHQNAHWKINFLQIFKPANDLPSEPESLPDLLSLLLHRNVRYLYADRWVANAVHSATAGQLWTPLDSQVFPNYQHPLASLADDYLYPILPAFSMILTQDTALLVRLENAPLVRKSLAEHHIGVDEDQIGPWVLFSFSPAQWDEANVQIVPLRWVGFGCLTMESRDRRSIQPEFVGSHSFFYADNNWTAGNMHIRDLNYMVQPDDTYLVLSLKGQPPHGHDRDSLDILIWINGKRLPFSTQDGWNFYFALNPRTSVINLSTRQKLLDIDNVIYL